jgi:hypothetical protein
MAVRRPSLSCFYQNSCRYYPDGEYVSHCWPIESSNRWRHSRNERSSKPGRGPRRSSTPFREVDGYSTRLVYSALIFTRYRRAAPDDLRVAFLRDVVGVAIVMRSQFPIIYGEVRPGSPMHLETRHLASGTIKFGLGATLCPR